MELLLADRKVVERLEDRQQLLLCRCNNPNEHKAQAFIRHVEASLSHSSAVSRLEAHDQCIDTFIVPAPEVHELIESSESCFFLQGSEARLQCMEKVALQGQPRDR